MTRQLELIEFPVEVLRKPIKQAHLAVHPPDGHVVLSVPIEATDDMVASHIQGNLAWILAKRRLVKSHRRDSQKDFITRETHYVWGKRHLLEVRLVDGTPQVEVRPKKLVLAVPAGFDRGQRAQVIAAWYRQQVARESQILIPKWEARFGASVSRCFVQTMKTRWGSTNTNAQTIRVNSALATYPVDVLDYVLAYQILALRVSPKHKAFARLLDQHCPSWRSSKAELDEATPSFLS